MITPKIAANAMITAAVLAVAAVGTGCSDNGPSGGDVEFVVSAPVSTSPWIARFERNGAELAAAQLNDHGGIKYSGKTHHVVVTVLDNAGSPQQVAAHARKAVADHAAAFIIDGVGAAAVADVTGPAGLPTFVVFDGGASIVDPDKRPTIYRLAPADRFMTMRLADYLAAKHPRIGILADDTSFGTDGEASLLTAFNRDDIDVATKSVVPTGSGDVTGQVLAARSRGVTALVVWADAPVVAAAINAARSAGWNVPIWAGPSGEDPLVRQRLAAHPEWLTGVGFVSFRITAEVGPANFAKYRKAYVGKFGEDKVGVTQGGKQVVQPPDWSMFSYDVVNLVADALGKAGATGPKLQATLAGHDVIVGANGDERGYGESSREGVSPDDMYFARFDGFVFAPVTDDLLSQNLPAVPQVL
ncbi:MAG: branched-chain amino acid transport system substrate-binding protein [Frankiaceae bacterium]|jgi:ABC-type branched-subunit amino acid transport system substrate-binding protein|nr:branched-chain amino acid transport system substrate-binding protein [Frankiaceae bacterium]